MLVTGRTGRTPMPKTLTLQQLDDEVVERLHARATRNGRSTEAEARAILAEAVSGEPRPDFWEMAAKVRALTAGIPQTPSEELQREGRDER